MAPRRLTNMDGESDEFGENGRFDFISPNLLTKLIYTSEFGENNVKSCIPFSNCAPGFVNV